MTTIKNLLSDTNEFKFKSFKSSFVNQIDVYHKNSRIAIIEGIDGALLRYTKSDVEISYKNMDKLENMVKRLFRKANNIK